MVVGQLLRRLGVPLRCLALVAALGAPLAPGGRAAAEDPPAPPAAQPEPTAEQQAAQAKALAHAEAMVKLNGEARYAEALVEARAARESIEKAFGVHDPQVSRMLANEGELERTLGRLDEARATIERSVAVIEAAAKAKPAVLAQPLPMLGATLLAQGTPRQALRVCRRTLSILEGGPSEQGASLPMALNQVAMIQIGLGEYGEARALLERALGLIEAQFGSMHAQTSNALVNLASVVEQMDSPIEARPLYERALLIQELSLEPGDPDLARLRGTLAALLSRLGLHAEALPLAEQSLKAVSESQGENHPDTVLARFTLGTALIEAGRAPEGMRQIEQAIAAQESISGDDHIDLAVMLQRLAKAHLEKGDVKEAQALVKRSAEVTQSMLGPACPQSAFAEVQVATAAAADPDPARAREHFERALAMQEEYVRGQLAPLDATQRRALLGDTRRLLAAWLQFAPRAQRSGYEEVLRFKGLVGRAEAAERVVARRAGPDEAALRDRLVALQRRVASLANQIPPGTDPVERNHWQETYAAAREEQTEAARALSEKLAPLKAARARFDIDLAAIQARIPKDGALVDMLKVGDDRYMAWVVRASGAPVRVDLGMSEPIDAACSLWTRAIMSENEESLHEMGSDLRDLVWEPIEDVLGPGVARLILCTDSALAAIPFAALPGSDPEKRLLDERALSHVMYAQDLVPVVAGPPGRGGALLLGAVDYDAAEGAPSGHAGAAAPSKPIKGFEALTQTEAEIEALQALLGEEAVLKLRRQATEAALRDGSKGRRFVHVATHGFARQDLQAGLRRPKGSRDWTDVFLERRLALGHDPLALSGLALAGANPRAGGGDDDGIFTALEASYLDLDGVDLVTLSACETARGSVAVGEGVLGLVSAFQMAGARDVLASLWKVDDEATRRLMEGIYARMLRKESPLDPAAALREAALALRDGVEPDGKRRFASPRYWAAFVAYGR